MHDTGLPVGSGGGATRRARYALVEMDPGCAEQGAPIPGPPGAGLCMWGAGRTTVSRMRRQSCGVNNITMPR